MSRRLIAPELDFLPGVVAVDYARRHGLELEEERDGWLDWCAANGKRYVDCQAGFRTWLRHAVQYGRGTKATEVVELVPDVPQVGPYRCPLDLDCDNGWDRDSSPARRCECLSRRQTRVRSLVEYRQEKEKGAPSEENAPNPTLFTDLVVESVTPASGR